MVPVFAWEILVSASKSKDVGEKLKVIFIGLFKPCLIERKKIESLIIFRNGITQ